MKIAVIEDDPAFLFLYFEEILKGLEFDEYTSFSDFEESDKKYDILLLDLNLPDKWGLDVVKSARAMHDGLILVATGTADGLLRGKNMRDIINAGANDVFQKKFLTDAVYAKMLLNEISTYKKN